MEFILGFHWGGRMKNLIYLLVVIFSVPNVWAASKETYRVESEGNIYVIHSPYGDKTFFGDSGLENQNSFKFEVPIESLKPSALSANSDHGGDSSSTNNGGASSSPKAPTSFDDENELIDQANHLYYAGKFNDSLKYADEILRRDPKNIRAWVMKGSLLHVLGQKQLAKNAWTKASELDPKNDELKKILRGLK